MMDNIPSGPAMGDTIVTAGSAPINESIAEPIIQTAPVEQVAEPEPPKQTSVLQEQNFNKLRREKERAQQERDDYARRLQQYEQSYKPVEQQASPIEEPVNLKDDEIPEWRHVNKELNRLRQELNQYKQQSTQSIAESRFKAQYPDGEKVVTDENLKTLRELDPELAETILANTNSYSQLVTAYKQIKLHGIYQEDTYGNDRDRAQKNAAKPRPLASLSPQQADSPLSQVNAFAHGLTPELKKQLRIEMEDAIRRRNG